MSASIDFSAQFGGGDAADALLPHFRALKAAAKNLKLKDFPFGKLAFILRVDGEVAEYGQSGIGNIDIDHDGNYVSVDIGITKGDRHAESGNDGVADFLIAAIESSASFLQAVGDARLQPIDYADLREVLLVLCESYRSEVNQQRKSPSH